MPTEAPSNKRLVRMALRATAQPLRYTHMMTIPTDPKKIRARISSYKSSLRREKKEHGTISDGSGKRMILFWLYFLLDDHDAAREYFEWYEAEFPDDMGEPIQHLCWALSLHRMDNDSPARSRLAIAMLSNSYVIPKILEREMPSEIRTGSNFEWAEYIDDCPPELFDAINESDREWMGAEYDSLDFVRLRKRHRELQEKLAKIEVGTERRRVVKQLFALLRSPLAVRLT